MTDPLAALLHTEFIGCYWDEEREAYTDQCLPRHTTDAARLRAAGVTLADGLDVERLADAFTWFHVHHAGMCGGSHLDDAREYEAQR